MTSRLFSTSIVPTLGEIANGGMAPPKRVCIIGSGNWGSAIATLVGHNAKANPEVFEETVNMWVFEEQVGFKK